MENRRSKMTKKLIKEALIELLSKKIYNIYQLSEYVKMPI